MTPAAVATRKSMEPWVKDSVQYYQHQVEGIRMLARRKSFLLADDMGLGKSLQALTIFAIDVVRGWAERAIVICPVSLKGNWADELEKFTGFPFVVLDGTPAQRKVLLAEFDAIVGPKVLIVNYEQVSAHQLELNRLRFDVGIWDEAHYLKNPKTKRTKASIALKTRRAFLLTGTPMLNHVNELWSLFHKIDPVRFPKYWSFVNRYCVFGGYKDKQIIGVKNEAELHAILGEYQLRRLKSEVLDLPEVQIIQRRVDLLPEQRKVYNEVFDELKLVRSDGSEDEIDNALTKFLRLKQICGTTLPFTGEDHSSKLDVVIEDDLELLSIGHRVVIFTQFRDVQAAYVQRMTKADPSVPIFQLHGDVPIPTRQGVVKQWGMTQQPGVLVCMVQVAGVGLNMVQSRQAAFIDKLFVPGLNRQAIDRLHRIGQSETQPVQVREYICRNTIESRVDAINRTKSKLFGEIVETDPNWKRKLIQAMMEEEGE